MKLNFQSTQYWMMKLKTNHLENDPSQPELTYQIHDLKYEAIIIQ